MTSTTYEPKTKLCKSCLLCWALMGLIFIAIAVLWPEGAKAADLRAPPIVKAEPPPVVYVPTWTGLWVEGAIGGSLVKTDVNSIDLAVLGKPSTGSFHNNGLLIGGEIDARYQAPGSSLVFGLDAIIDWANTKGGDGGCSALVGVRFGCVTKNSFFGFAGGELGLSTIGGSTALPWNPANLTPLAVPFGNVKVSMLAGAAFRDFKIETTDLTTAVTGAERHTVLGFAAGAALDVAVTPNIAIGVRYIHPFWKSNSCSGAMTTALGTGVNCSFKEKEDVGLVTLSYKLPVLGAGAPVALRSRY